MKLHRDLGITQKSAWHLAHRLRKAWDRHGRPTPFSGPVEVDETFIGGKRKNMSNAKRKELQGTGRGAIGKTAVVGIKGRESNQVSAKVVQSTDAPTLIPFIEENASDGSTIHTDDASAYHSLPTIFNRYRHGSVNHSIGEYVPDRAHSNGVEAFGSMRERGCVGTYPYISPEHLDRYVTEFAGRHNIRNADTLDQMACVALGLLGKRLEYKELIGEATTA